MSTVTRNLWRKEETVAGKSAGQCFTWPTQTTWFRYPVAVGGEVTLEHENPNWRQDIALGRNASTTFIANDIELTHKDCFIETSRWCNHSLAKSWSTEVWSGAMHGSDVAVPSAASTNIYPEVDGRALREYVKDARRTQGAFRGSTFVAELSQALRMVRNPAVGLRGLVDRQHQVTTNRLKRVIGRDPRGVRVRDLSRAQRRNAQRAVSESWLEHQFGWLPLINDIGEGYKSLQRFADREGRAAISGYAHLKEQTGHTTNTTSSTRNLDIFTEVFDFSEASVRYYGAVKVRTQTFASDAIEEFGFRTRDFIPALWEWIPYSFLVDYFTNIGDLVESACFPRSDLAWTSRTFRNTNVRDGSRITYKKKNTFVYPTSGTIRVDAFFPSTKVWRRKYVERTVWGGSLVPDFQWEIPGFKNWRRYLNMAALANLRFMKR